MVHGSVCLGGAGYLCRDSTQWRSHVSTSCLPTAKLLSAPYLHPLPPSITPSHTLPPALSRQLPKILRIMHYCILFYSLCRGWCGLTGLRLCRLHELYNTVRFLGSVWSVSARLLLPRFSESCCAFLCSVWSVSTQLQLRESYEICVSLMCFLQRVVCSNKTATAQNLHYCVYGPTRLSLYRFCIIVVTDATYGLVATAQILHHSVYWCSVWSVPTRLRPLASGVAAIVSHILGDVPTPPLVGLLQGMFQPNGVTTSSY